MIFLLAITQFTVILDFMVMSPLGDMLMKSLPGAFMSINSSLQQFAGGIAAAVSGMIVVQETKFSPLENYDLVGYVIVVISMISIFLMYRVSKLAVGS